MRVSVLWQILGSLTLSGLILVPGVWLNSPGLIVVSFLLIAGVSVVTGYRVRNLGRDLSKVGAGGLILKVQKFQRFLKDELDDFIETYNGVAERAEDLISQIAEKIGVEKEVQTAEIVQSLFYPASNFSSRNLNLAGKVLTATQCAGDWWHYDLAGDNLIVGVGDATGHGVAAALMMAAVHGAYAISMRESEINFDNSDGIPLPAMMAFLNESCRSVSGGENTMTFIASKINLKTGVLTLANASHPSPYLLRRNPGSGAVDVKDWVKPLKSVPADALGLAKDFKVESRDYQLEPGDTVIWYTDGLLVFNDPQFGTSSRLGMLRFLASVVERLYPNPEKICEAVLAYYQEKRRELPENLVDDVTIVVAVIPPDAKLESTGKTA